MSQIAKGTFDVQLTPQPATPGHEASQVGRMAISKRFHGDLEGTSLGEMLAYRSAVAGSAGYVAMERVEARLAGREGGFVLMHTGEMNRGQPSLIVQVVPDSGTGALVGISGRLSIEIREGTHCYALVYELPPSDAA